jgi:hypothetical protein
VQVAARTGAHCLGIELEEKRHTAALTVSYQHNIYISICVYTWNALYSHHYVRNRSCAIVYQRCCIMSSVCLPNLISSHLHLSMEHQLAYIARICYMTDCTSMPHCCLYLQLRTCLEEVFRVEGYHRAANTLQQLTAHNAATSRVDLREGCFSFSEAQIKDATVIVSTTSAHTHQTRVRLHLPTVD